MASKKNKSEIRYKLTDEDFNAFGHYRILYTKGGRKLVNMQRITYLISGAMLAILFTVFNVDPTFRKVAYVVAAVIGIGGTIFAERLVLRQQDRELERTKNSMERIHPEENVVILGSDEITAKAGSSEKSFAYKDIKLVDLTDEAIYVWLSDEVIMPVPLHAFGGMPEMKEVYKFIRAKIKEQGGDTGDNED